MPLEERCLLAPFVPIFPLTGDLHGGRDARPTPFLGTVDGRPRTRPARAISTAGADHLGGRADAALVVRRRHRPDQGRAGRRLRQGALRDLPRRRRATPSAVNRPGVIYRVDPATGKASVFFDLNTVMNQIDPNALSTDGKNPAANSLGASTGYVNWYDIAFDPEGYFRRQARRCSSARSIAPTRPRTRSTGSRPDGTVPGGVRHLHRRPGGDQVQRQSHGHGRSPGPRTRQFLRGLIAGSGISTTGGTFAALFFNSNAYSPGQVISNGTLPKGVTPTGMTLGTIVGMTAGERRLLLAGLLGLHRLRHAGRRAASRRVRAPAASRGPTASS